MNVQNDLNVISSDRLFVLDLDRCLITDRAYSLLEQVIVNASLVTLESFHAARQKVEISGGSFDSIKWLQYEGGVSDVQVRMLLERYVVKAHSLDPDNLLAPGARDLINILRNRNLNYMIMTYGGERYQKAKIDAAGLSSIPYSVVDHRHKGRHIASLWSESSQLFEIVTNQSTYRTPTITLVDDKASAFDDLPPLPQARGYWLKAGNVLRSQAGDIPSNVKIIKTLTDIISIENLS
jgi:hypothetical protein